MSPLTWSELSPHLDRALDLEADEREIWLAELAVDQPAVAGAVRRFLAENYLLSASGFLENPPLELIDRAVEHAVEERFSLSGHQVGAYTVERLIGRGGMGEVWLATRSDGRFEARYAIKFLDRLVLQARLVERFHREGRLLGRLAHPHIARLIDAGVATDGRQYLVLEYVDGERIDTYCQSHALSIDARVRLFLDVVAAVAHAHANLVVHRDLKPSNVLVTHDGMVKLLDFGIAKLLTTDEPQHEATATQLEEIALTPEYAAPEQLLGDMPSTATDVYQLGMLLYVLLAGRHPLSATGSRADRIKAVLDAPLPRASKFAEGAERKQLRGDLDAILAMALRKDPHERYVTAAALRDDLQRYLRHEPVDAQRGAALYGLRKFMRRHRVAVAGSAVALLSLCAALVFAFSQARVAATERDRAFALVSRNAAVTEFLGRIIIEAAVSAKPITVSEMLERSERLALNATRDSPENRAAVLEMIAGHFGSLDDWERAEQLTRRALALAANSTDQALRSRLTCEHASAVSNLGRREEAASAISKELQHLDADPETASHCLLQFAWLRWDEGRAQDALRYAQQGLERTRLASRPMGAVEANLLGAVAHGYHMNGRNAEAAGYFEQALRKYAEIGQENDYDALVIVQNWAVMNRVAGMPKQALQLYDRIRRAETEREPGAQPTPLTVGNRARALQALGRFEEARAEYELECRLADKHPNDTFGRAHCLLGLAELSLEMESAGSAADYLQRANILLGPALPQDSPPMLAMTLLRGKLDLAAGRFAQARWQFDQVLAAKTATFTGVSAALAKAETGLAENNPAAAARDARFALQMTRSLQGGLPYSNTTGIAWLLLGRALQRQGDTAKAHQAFAAAVNHLSHCVDPDHPELRQAQQLYAAQ